MRDHARSLFTSYFGSEPVAVIRSPGRVNLIGDHTDYNGGFVLPLAIQLGTWMAVRPRDDMTVRVTAQDFGQAEFDLTAFERNGSGWVEYVRGVAWAKNARRGFDAAIVGNLPIGAGLSSSASLELAAARAIDVVEGRPVDPRQDALAAQKAENDWVGVACGIMDQLVIATAVEGTALMIDCRSLETWPCPIPPGSSVVILDTGTRRELVNSAYNDRRRTCAAAAATLGVATLSEISAPELAVIVEALTETQTRRVRHVVTENARTLAASELMKAGDARGVGRLMLESHVSLRDDYEVSSPALDSMVDAAMESPGVFGARMTGGGFGGSAVALVDTERLDRFMEETERAYRAASGLEPTLLPCVATGGTDTV